MSVLPVNVPISTHNLSENVVATDESHAPKKKKKFKSISRERRKRDAIDQTV